MPNRLKAAQARFASSLLAGVTLLSTIGAPFCGAAPAISPVDLFKAYLRVDTTNPPGNELRAARFWKRFFDREGIESTVYDLGHGRGNVLARVKSSRKKPALVFLNHLDVVPADVSHWKTPPFAAKEIGSRIYARGASDMKGTAVCQALALVTAKRENWALDRDLIFLGTADEETGTQSGLREFLEKHAADLGDVEFVLTEGNNISLKNGKPFAWNVATGEKTRLELTVIAHGIAGHPVDANPNPAIPRLVKALDKILSFSFPIRITPSVERYLRDFAPFAPDDEKAFLRDPRAIPRDAKAQERLLADSEIAPLLHTTAAATVLRAGHKTNVVPGEASAVVDLRLLPGEDARQLAAALHRMIDDKNIELRFTPPENTDESPVDTELFRAIVKARDHFDPGVPVLTPTLTSSTDAPYFRKRGVVVYGFEPFRLAEDDDHSHGDNEFLSRENLLFGIDVTRYLARELAKAP